MIAVAIAGSLITYAWVMGYIGFTTEKAGQAIMIQSVANDGTDTNLMVYVQNVGEGTVELDPLSCLYVNGELKTCTILPADGIVAEGDTATLTYAGGAAAAGEKVTVKVVSALGTFSEKSNYPAEASGGSGPGPTNDPPTAAFTFLPTDPDTGETVTFTDASTDSDGTVVGWDWDFDDGGTSTDQNPAHVFASAGTYTVTLTVTDNDGATDDYSDDVTVTNPPQTLTLRPTDDGTSTALTNNNPWWYDNWECVDDTGSGDGDSTYVYDNSEYGGYATDTYITEDHGSASGTIISVTVYINCRKDGSDPDISHARTALRIGSTNYYGDEEDLTSSWTTYSKTYTSNPAGGAWTWTATDSLQCGVSLDTAEDDWPNSFAWCTQVYIVVTYTP
jgi:PKD repeat protein